MVRFIPRGSERHGGRVKEIWRILLTYGLLTAAPVGLFAQTGDTIPTHYVSSRSLRIPFSFNDNDPRIEVLLHVSTDEQSYRFVNSAKLAQRYFYFSAPADGGYSFIVQTRDGSGAVTPASLRGTQPNMRIYVDTQPPVIEELAAVAASPDNPLPGIRWRITEPNLKEIWADYRPIGGVWMPLFLPPPLKTEGTHIWKPHWGGELEVRMQAVDKANNHSEIKYVRLRVADNVARMPPPPDTAGKVIYVKSKTFQLHYTLDEQTVGPSNVASVDIWKLHPGPGQRWGKCSEKGPARGPATVTVDTAGRWGFRLIPRSGAGMAERDPQPGDTPDILVEVDDKSPQVKVTDVKVNQEADGGYLTVYWKADDAFLRAMPINIYWATNSQSNDWAPFLNGTNLPNTGNWRQKIDDLKLEGRYEFALKVTATDEANNTGLDVWREMVKVDLRVPRIKSIEVKPSEGQQTYNSPGTSSISGQPTGSRPPSLPQPSSLNGSGQGFNKVNNNP